MVIGDIMARKKRGKVTPKTIEEMKKLRKKGMSYNKIADKLGLSVMTVYNHLKKAPKGRRKVTPEVIEKMKRLRNKGMSYNTIADKLGLSVMTVYNHLKKEEKVGLIDEKVEEKKEEKVGLIERLKRALGIK